MPLAPSISLQLQGSPFDPLATKPRYQVQFWDMTGAGFGPGNLIVEFENAKNLGYSDYANDVPEAFCTIDQLDAKAAVLDSYVGLAHMIIRRNGEVVWTGFLLDSDEQTNDIIFYGYGYLAALFWSVSAWAQSYVNKDAGYIVRDQWNSAQTVANSTLGFVATGVIEPPATDATLGIAWQLPLYKAFYKRVLFTLQELVAGGASDTTNMVIFEITHSLTPQFNLWRNRQQVRSDLKWEFGGVINGFSRYRSQTWHRNQIKGVGNAPHNQLLNDTQSSSSDISAFGLRAEPIFLSWVRDSGELSRVDRLRLSRALKMDNTVWLHFKPNSQVPPGVWMANLQIGDLVPVKIKRGITNLSQNFIFAGYQMKWDGAEHFSALIQSQ